MTGNPGPQKGAVGSAVTAAFGLGALFHSLVDYPMRLVTGGMLASTTFLVPSSPQSYDAKLAKVLWEESAKVLGLPVEVGSKKA